MRMPSPDTEPGKKLSIAFVYDDSLDGYEGVAQYVKALGAWLSSEGHRVSYLVGQTDSTVWQGGRIYSLAKNVRVKFNRNWLSVPLPANKSKIIKTLEEVKPDVLHIQMPHSPLMAQRVIDRAASAAVGTFHIYPAGTLAAIASRLLKLAYLGKLKKITKVVAVSPVAREFAKTAFGISAELSSNVVNLKAFKSNVENKPGTVVFLGRLVERKGCRQLIEAFNLVCPKLDSAKLIIGGSGPQEAELRQLVSQLSLDGRVEFLGFIPEEKKADFLAGATVACFPSLYGESFGIVLIEAMAAGAGVVIGGDNPGYISVLGEKPELLFDPTDKEALAAKLFELLSDHDKRRALQTWQTANVKKYDVETVGRQIEAIYRQVIAKASAKGHNNS